MIPARASRRIELLKRQIDEAKQGHPDDFKGWRERTRAALRVTLGQDHPAIERFDDIRYGLAIWTEGTPESAWDSAQADGVRSGIAILEGAIHEIEASESEISGLSTGGFHSWVAGAVTGLWDDGHYRQAVDEAARAIELRLRSKINVDLSGTALVTEAFNPDPPRPGHPRLRFAEFEERSKAWTDAHQGAMHFGQGCMLRIRNLLEHHEDDIEEQVALESLAALSLLARWIDAAQLATGRP